MSIRTVKTPFPQPHSSSYPPSLSNLSLHSQVSRPLYPLDMNAGDVDRMQVSELDFSNVELALKCPPGLEGMVVDMPVDSAPHAPPQQHRRTRQRSGSFTYPSGCSYNHFEKMASLSSLAPQQSRIFTPSMPHAQRTAPQPTKRMTGRVGFVYPTNSHKSIWGPPPPPPSAQRSSSGRFGFDPFGDESDSSSDSSDEGEYGVSHHSQQHHQQQHRKTTYTAPYHSTNSTPNLIGNFHGVGISNNSVSVSATNYSHYWQYDPSTNKPVLVFTPPPSTASAPPPSQKPKTKANSLKPLIFPGQQPIQVPAVPTFNVPLPSSRSPSPPSSRPASPSPSRSALSRHQALRSISPPASIPIPMLFPPSQDKATCHRKLAITLLNRIYSSGASRMGISRRTSLGPAGCAQLKGKGYVKSGLSYVLDVTDEA